MKFETMSHRLLSFSADPSLRKPARVEKVEEFLKLAREVSSTDSRGIEMMLSGSSLFIHDLDEPRLIELLTFLSMKLDRFDFEQWISRGYDWALRDRAFEAIPTIHKFTNQVLVFEADSFKGSITPELIDFLETNREICAIRPFIQLRDWCQNPAGIEGFVRLIKLVNLDELVRHFTNGHEEYEDYGALSLLCEEGAFDGYFDQQTISVLIARGLIAGLSKAATGAAVDHILKRFEPSQVLTLLAAEAKKPICSSGLTQALAKVYEWAQSKN